MTDPLDASLKEALGETREVPPGLVQKAKDLVRGPRQGEAKCPHCGKPIALPRRPGRGDWNLLWAAASAAAFGASFYFEEYFFQALAASIIFAFKWAVEWRARKTQILIYKALAEGEGAPGQHRLHQHTTRL
jgi:hypothetical protein